MVLATIDETVKASITDILPEGEVDARVAVAAVWFVRDDTGQKHSTVLSPTQIEKFLGPGYLSPNQLNGLQVSAVYKDGKLQRLEPIG